MSTQLIDITYSIDPFVLIARADLADSTRVKYERALRRYLEAGGRLGDAQALAAYADTVSDTEQRFLSAVVGKWADAMADQVKGQATPATVDAVTATVYRLQALKKAVSPPAPKGEATHTWLSPQQVKALSNKIGNGMVGARDRVAIGLLVAAGLRREEAVSLTWEGVKWQPYADKVRTVLAIKGKGARRRTVPVSDVLAADLDRWADYAGRDGRILRSLGRSRTLGASLSAVALFKLVRKYGASIGVPELAPHDCRRTYARIAYDNGVDIGQIALLLGHESIETTQRYLGVSVDLSVTASDFIPWG